MLLGHQKRVPGEERPYVEEGQGPIVFENDLGGTFTLNYRAEDAHEARPYGLRANLSRMIEVRPQTVVVYGDIGCPWAHLAVYRLHSARTRAGLEEAISFDIRCFPLELFNSRPTPKLTLDAETAVAGGLDPEAGWKLWSERESTYPVTTLLAMEAVHAAKEQGLGLSDRLDRALRVAFFRDSRCISMHHVILEVSEEVPGLDIAALESALKDGRARSAVFADKEDAERNDVKGSPHLFTPDGSNFHNPGIKMHWEGKRGGFPVIEEDDQSIYDRIVKLAEG
jgi:predicted DsbA family dithiol-disulfide isomerase